jgi:hypothetical protein
LWNATKQLACLATTRTVHQEFLALYYDKESTIRTPYWLYSEDSPALKKI